MGLKTAEKEIGGVTFIVTQLGAFEGSKTLLRLTKAVGPAVGTVARSVLQGADRMVILDVVISALQSLPESEFEGLIKTFAGSTKVRRPFVGDKSVTQKLNECIDEVLGGEYLTLLEWLTFAVTVNYADFFGNAIRIMGKDGSQPEKAE